MSGKKNQKKSYSSRAVNYVPKQDLNLLHFHSNTKKLDIMDYTLHISPALKFSTSCVLIPCTSHSLRYEKNREKQQKCQNTAFGVLSYIKNLHKKNVRMRTKKLKPLSCHKKKRTRIVLAVVVNSIFFSYISFEMALI